MINYFAYGSNMNPKRMKDRGVIFGNPRPAMLQGFELTFDKMALKGKQGFATVKPKKNESVQGVLYSVNDYGIRRLDAFEGYPYHYKKYFINVDTRRGIEESIIYIANPRMTKKGLLPSEEYLGHLLQGKNFLSKNYLKKLEMQECL